MSRRYIFAGSQHHIRQFKRACAPPLGRYGFDLVDYATSIEESKNMAQVDLYITTGRGPIVNAVAKTARARKKVSIHLTSLKWQELKNEMRERGILPDLQNLHGFYDDVAAEVINPVLSPASLEKAIGEEEHRIAKEAANKHEEEEAKKETEKAMPKKKKDPTVRGLLHRAGGQVWITGSSVGGPSRPIIYDGVVCASGTDVTRLTEGKVTKGKVFHAANGTGRLKSGEECRYAEMAEALTMPGYVRDASRDEPSARRIGQRQSRPKAEAAVVIPAAKVEPPKVASPKSPVPAPEPPKLVVVQHRANTAPAVAQAPPAPTARLALKVALKAAMDDDDMDLVEILAALIRKQGK